MNRRKRYACLTARLLANAHFDKQGCLLWDGAVSKDGYGRISFRTPRGPRHKSAHSVAFKWWGGTYPTDGKLEYSHQCGKSRCINPSCCLFESHQENLARRGEVPF